MPQRKRSRLTRPRHPMPAFVRRALTDAGLMEAYQARPPYQRNDYIGWITRAKKPETRDKRLSQMLDELAQGDRYMKMRYGGSVSRSVGKSGREERGVRREE